MPGILPMKVIKVGSNAQSRIAQACDRCRSKKIRCDGTTPCCSQCANVGFECKTSDKLSRRAFPRGYTESLEERVRSLESEVKELKDLLDAKDEKIDMLSRIHSNSPLLHRPSSTFSSSTKATSVTSLTEAGELKGEASDAQETPAAQENEEAQEDRRQTSCSAADSNGKSFVGMSEVPSPLVTLTADEGQDAFKVKVKDSDNKCPMFRTQAFFDATKQRNPCSKRGSTADFKLPCRMESDRMINLFFQEWSPLFPILHRQGALKLYEDYVSEPDHPKAQHSIAQLNLLFGIASLSTETPNDAQSYESQWQPALEAVIKDVSIPTLQCVLLALIHCIAKHDYDKLPKYKASAVKLSRRLGLHQSQKRSSLSAFITEIRKRLFWTLYTLDCFSASLLGEPRSLDETDISCEFPEDIGDEDLQSHRPGPPTHGETTRLSSALAVFGGARILSRVLDNLYPVKTPHPISLSTIGDLSQDLDSWLAGLPSHLRLKFVQDKPSTNLVESRSPFVSLIYHYIRTLIHRPLASSNIGNQTSSSIFALGESSKHIVQIVQLLEERCMSFSFCLNKSQILTMAGFGLLYQNLDLNRQGKLHQDSERLLRSIVSILNRDDAQGAIEFTKIACNTTNVDLGSQLAASQKAGSVQIPKSSQSMPAPKRTTKALHRNGASESSVFPYKVQNSPPIKSEMPDSRRFSTTSLPAYDRTYSYGSFSNFASQSYYATAPSENLVGAHYRRPSESLPNLDYLDFNNEPATPSTASATPSGVDLSSYINTNLYNDNAGQECQPQPLQQPAQPVDPFSYLQEMPTSKPFEWCSDMWMIPDNLNGQGATSFSEDDLTSGEELSSCGASGQFALGTSPQDEGFGELDGGLNATLGL